MFRITESDERATIYIYGTIGDHWNEKKANRAADFASALDDLSPKPLDIRIDSPGGDAFDGFAIASAIQRYEGETHAYIDGMAASAASYIALMCDRVTMNDYAMFMIHNAWGLCIGNRNELREMADRLEVIDGAIADVIAKRSGMELDAVKAAMDAETWYRADEALAEGICDEVLETEQRIAACIERGIAGRYRNIPDDVEIVDAMQAEEEAGAEPQDADAEPLADGISHGEHSMQGNEAKVAEGATLLGNRVYLWKE